MMKKFGFVLVSRQSGKEAYMAYLPTLREIPDSEEVVVDFEGVRSFAPSWGDEFLTPLLQTYGERLSLKNTDNPSVVLTIETLEKANNVTFNII